MRVRKLSIKLFITLIFSVVVGCTTNTKNNSSKDKETISKENNEKKNDAMNDCAKFGMSQNVQSIKVFIYEAIEKFDKIEKGKLKEDGHYYFVFDEVATNGDPELLTTEEVTSESVSDPACACGSRFDTFACYFFRSQ